MNWRSGISDWGTLRRYWSIIAMISLAGCGAAARAPVAPTASPASTALPRPAPTAPAAIAGSATPTATAQPRPAPTELPPAPTAALASPSPFAGTPAPALEGQPITSTAHLDLYRTEGGLAASTLLSLAPRFEQAIDRVSERIGARLSGRVALSFEPAQRGPCALRGLTLSHQRIIRLYYAPDTPEDRVLAVVAHELAHELQHDYYGWPAHQRSDTILLEGQATWASGDYALDQDGRPSWQGAAEQALAEGALPPLDISLEADCRTTTRNSAYVGWASFVAYLLRDGRERFDALYRSGGGHRPGTADYLGVYGKQLHQLDQEWREWLGQQRPTT